MSLADRIKGFFNRFRRKGLPESESQDVRFAGDVDAYKDELRRRDASFSEAYKDLENGPDIESDDILPDDSGEGDSKEENSAQPVDLEQELKNKAMQATGVEIMGEDGTSSRLLRQDGKTYSDTRDKPVQFNIPVGDLAKEARKLRTDEADEIPDNMDYSEQRIPKQEQPKSQPRRTVMENPNESRDRIRAANEMMSGKNETARFATAAALEAGKKGDESRAKLREQQEQNKKTRRFTRVVSAVKDKFGGEHAEDSETAEELPEEQTEEAYQYSTYEDERDINYDNYDKNGRKISKIPIEALSKQQRKERLKKIAPFIMGFVVAGAALGYGTYKLFSSDDETSSSPKAKKISGNDYIVCYDEAIKYDKIVDIYDVAKVKLGDIMVFETKTVGYYDIDKDKAKHIDEEKNYEHSAIDYQWVIATKIDDNDQVSGYVPVKNVDLYYQFKAEGGVIVRSEPSDEKGYDSVYGVLKKGNKLWICKDEIVTGPGVQDGYYKALYRDNQTGELKSAYVLMNNVVMLEKSTENYCIAKSDLNLKSLPYIQNDSNRFEVGTAKNGEIYKVKDAIDVDGTTWYKCDDTYISANALKPLKDFSEDVVVGSMMNGVVTSKNGNIQRAQVGPDTLIHVDTSKVYNGKYQVYIDDSVRNIRCTGYMDAEVLGLPDKIESTKQPLNYSKDGYCYILNVDEYKHLDGFIETAEKLQEKNLLGGVMFCVGRSSEGSNSNSLYMTGFADDQTDSLSSENDETVLNQYLDEIKSKFNNGYESLYYNDSLGSIKRLEEFIKEASDRDIPVGFYYEQCSTNPNRASAEAGYVYGVTQKVKADMGNEFDDVYELPYMESVGAVSPEVDYDADRATSIIGKMSLMATGQSGVINYNGIDINEDSTDYFWTIDGVDKTQGYHLMDDVNNQFIYRTSIISDNNVSFEQFARIGEELASKGISMDVDGKQIVTANRNMEALYDKDNPYEFFNTGIMGYRNLETFNYDVFCRSDISTFLEDFKGEYNFSTTLALTSKKTIEGMCNGTYVHTNTFTGKLDEVVAKNIKNYDTER